MGELTMLEIGETKLRTDNFTPYNEITYKTTLSRDLRDFIVQVNHMGLNARNELIEVMVDDFRQELKKALPQELQ
jgi:hypothetical protein